MAYLGRQLKWNPPNQHWWLDRGLEARVAQLRKLSLVGDRIRGRHGLGRHAVVGTFRRDRSIDTAVASPHSWSSFATLHVVGERSCPATN